MEFLVNSSLGENRVAVILAGGSEEDLKIGKEYRMTAKINNSAVIEMAIKKLKEKDGKFRDYIAIEYADGDKLYVPCNEMHIVQKYIGFEGRAPKLYKLGGSEWEAVKDRVNKLIKYMEPFRPFAPAILEEFQSDYFDYTNPVPYMTEVHPVKKNKLSKIPAVVHVDGSGRIQTVMKKTNPKFWKLIVTNQHSKARFH